MIMISGIPETRALFDLRTHEGWQQTALRVLRLVVLLIPCLVRDWLRKPDVRVENGNVVGAGFREQWEQLGHFLPIIQGYLGPEEAEAFDFPEHASQMLRGCKNAVEKSRCLTWFHWKQDRQLRTRQLSSPVPALNLHSISLIDLTGCDDSKTDLLTKFESLAGKTLRLPRMHAIAHQMVEQHAPKIAELEGIDFTCHVFHIRRTLVETIDILKNQSLQFRLIRYSSSHTSWEQLPVETMRLLMDQCQEARVEINWLPFRSEQGRKELEEQYSQRLVWLNKPQDSANK